MQKSIVIASFCAEIKNNEIQRAVNFLLADTLHSVAAVARRSARLLGRRNVLLMYSSRLISNFICGLPRWS